MRIALAQLNVTVGDLEGNTAKILRVMDQARDAGVELVAFPELAVTGYPPEDLLFKSQFVQANLNALRRIVEHSQDLTAVVGFVDRQEDLYNAAAVACDGRLVGVYHKAYLPNYGVFDENRYFQSGSSCPVFVLNGVTVGVNICEDIWYPGGPTKTQALIGDAELIVNISASPYHAGKGHARARMLATRAEDNAAIVAMVNLVGGQDELVFDGGSMIFDQNGDQVAQGRPFEEDLVLADLDVDAVFRRRLHDPRRRSERFSVGSEAAVSRIEMPDLTVSENRPEIERTILQELERPAEIYRALTLGTRDYVRKNGFEKTVLGLSGGIDSALTAVIAVDALGKENVIGVTMPSRYSSAGTRSDAEQLSKNLGIRFLRLPIEEVFSAFLTTLAEPFAGREPDLAEENLQARIRGNLLMALSNKFSGWLVLTTGNKSEASVGYATLYGDMAGGFSVINDIYKTVVYELAEYRNRQADREVIPRSIIDRAPSAELRPDQRDEDALPPYAVLDPILKAYVEEDRGVQEIASLGFDEEIVRTVLSLVDRSEYKRRQAPPGIKITPRAFGKDRRLPITNRNVEL